MYDLIIIGAGPAGTTAAIYAARQKLKTLVLTENIGGQTVWSSAVENYTGFQLISGVELAQAFAEHVKKYAIEIKQKELASSIVKQDQVFTVKSKNGSYEAKAVLVASGKQSRKLGVPGEEEFRNKGVFYCAICDGPLFGGKDVAIIGGGNSALDAALQMLKIANKVYIINAAEKLTGDAVFIEKAEQDPKVAIMNNTTVKDIYGDKFVQGLTVASVGQERKLELKGIFIEIGLIPNSIVGPEVRTNKNGEIIIDSSNRTNVAGLFAAGDVSNIAEKQIIIAAGEGAKACISAVKYLNSLKPKKEGAEMSKWKCLVCGYIYDPAQNNNISFQDLPADWVCPECGVGKDQFEEMQ